MDQTSTSQGSGSDPLVEGNASAPSTPTASVVGEPILKDRDSIGTDSNANSHGYATSTPSFSYNVPPNANTNSESPRQASSSPVSPSLYTLCFHAC